MSPFSPSGPQHIGVPWDFTLGTVGPEMPGARTDLVNEDKDGNGEVSLARFGLYQLSIDLVKIIPQS